jgi:hypothetical protein
MAVEGGSLGTAVQGVAGMSGSTGTAQAGGALNGDTGTMEGAAIAWLWRAPKVQAWSGRGVGPCCCDSQGWVWIRISGSAVRVLDVVAGPATCLCRRPRMREWPTTWSMYMHGGGGADRRDRLVRQPVQVKLVPLPHGMGAWRECPEYSHLLGRPRHDR